MIGGGVVAGIDGWGGDERAEFAAEVLNSHYGRQPHGRQPRWSARRRCRWKYRLDRASKWSAVVTNNRRKVPPAAKSADGLRAKSAATVWAAGGVIGWGGPGRGSDRGRGRAIVYAVGGDHGDAVLQCRCSGR